MSNVPPTTDIQSQTEPPTGLSHDTDTISPKWMTIYVHRRRHPAGRSRALPRATIATSRRPPPRRQAHTERPVIHLHIGSDLPTNTYRIGTTIRSAAAVAIRSATAGGAVKAAARTAQRATTPHNRHQSVSQSRRRAAIIPAAA